MGKALHIGAAPGGRRNQEGKEEECAREWLGNAGHLGPILEVIFYGFSGAHSQFVWSHWEQGADGLQAVFLFVVPQTASRYEVNFCCLADSDGTIPFNKIAAYHGEIAIDPASGAILRVEVDADLEPRLPMLSSGIVVEYGPVVLGEDIYLSDAKGLNFKVERCRYLEGMGPNLRSLWTLYDDAERYDL